MKSLLTLLLIFLIPFTFSGVFAQIPSQVIELKQLGKQGVLLDKGWKFKVGDNIKWAKPNFDDSGWQAINPLRDLHDLPQIRNTSMGWFRISFRVDSSLLHKPLALQVYQHLASEIYLNGNLLQRYGRVSAQAGQVMAYQPNYQPVGVLFEQPQQVLAIRFSVQENLPYFNFHSVYKAFELRINEVTGAAAFEVFTRRFHWRNYIESGIFILLALIFLGIFIVYNKQKAYLYFSLSNFVFGTGNLVYLGAVNSSDLAFKTYAAVTSYLFLWTLYNLFLLLAIYSLFSARKGFYYWLIIAYFLFGITFLFLNHQWGLILGITIPTVLGTIEMLRITWLAYREGRRGIDIVITGLVIYLVTYLVFIFMVHGFLPNPAINDSDTVMDIIYRVYISCLPISLTIYLAREYAFTSKDLEQKLVEVQHLSTQTIAQEQEKRQILSSQNETLEKQVVQRTAELSQQKEKLQGTLKHLKDTQSQLVQREKMASLGELTAGIAHEIQNPLNFVNNFSGLSVELIEELQQELAAGEVAEATTLSENIKQNLEKITHHGQRAGSIVKGMLQHSRSSTGEKQPADLNALTEEYLRLSYLGMQVKDKELNVHLVTDFDTNIGKVAVVPQEIGRVLLNLFNNAFYATQQKKSLLNGQYQPEVRVSTCCRDGKIEIKVRDNGSGIPEEIKNKIFQPFFTTKPTGQGTGLGLSLSYDIITKGHGGELKVASKEGEFAEFIIWLPSPPQI